MSISHLRLQSPTAATPWSDLPPGTRVLLASSEITHVYITRTVTVPHCWHTAKPSPSRNEGSSGIFGDHARLRHTYTHHHLRTEQLRLEGFNHFPGPHLALKPKYPLLFCSLTEEATSREGCRN